MHHKKTPWLDNLSSNGFFWKKARQQLHRERQYIRSALYQIKIR